jgi:uncharacterized protein YndB with AHSA1/START domain
MNMNLTPTRFGTIERTADGGLIRYERQLAFPVEEVWSAITEPARLADWWPPVAADVTVDLRVGGSISFPWPDGDETQTLAFTILRLQAPTLLEHSHTSPGSWMRYELDSLDGGAGTRLVATYFVPDPDMAIERGDIVGGHYGLDRLEAALAGHPVPWDMELFAELQSAYAKRDLA